MSRISIFRKYNGIRIRDSERRWNHGRDNVPAGPCYLPARSTVTFLWSDLKRIIGNDPRTIGSRCHWKRVPSFANRPVDILLQLFASLRRQRKSTRRVFVDCKVVVLNASKTTFNVPACCKTYINIGLFNKGMPYLG